MADDGDEPDIRTVLASTRERAELTHEQAVETSRQLLTMLQQELASIELSGTPSANAVRFVTAMWADLMAQKMVRMRLVADHLANSIGFIERAPSESAIAMVAVDQAASAESMSLELRVLEAGARLVAAVKSYGHAANS
jgi:hypothetical protein